VLRKARHAQHGTATHYEFSPGANFMFVAPAEISQLVNRKSLKVVEVALVAEHEAAGSLEDAVAA